MDQPIGICSLCGGTVTKHVGPWWGVNPPVATCSSCGAVEGPPQRVIPMQPVRRFVFSRTTGGYDDEQ